MHETGLRTIFSMGTFLTSQRNTHSRTSVKRGVLIRFTLKMVDAMCVGQMWKLSINFSHGYLSNKYATNSKV